MARPCRLLAECIPLEECHPPEGYGPREACRLRAAHRRRMCRKCRRGLFRPRRRVPCRLAEGCAAEEGVAEEAAAWPLPKREEKREWPCACGASIR